MNLPVIGDVLDTVEHIVDDLHTSDKERLEAETELRKVGVEEQRIEASLLLGQQEVNKAEAQHASVFVAGGRPAIIWVGAVGLAWTYVAHPFLMWIWALAQAFGWIAATLPPPPTLDIETLMALVSGVLGLGWARTFEKTKSVARSSIRGGK